MTAESEEELVKQLPDGCWIPKRTRVVAVGKRRVSLRRYMWALRHGRAPSGVEVKPKCGRRHCVNPKHCELAPSERAEELVLSPSLGGREAAQEWILVGDERVSSRVYAEIRRHPPASLATLRSKFGLSSSTIYKIRAGLVQRVA